MSDEGRARDALDRAARADALLRNELLNEAFQAIEQNIRDAWDGSHPDDWKGREQLFTYMKSLRSVRKWITDIANDGKMANQDLAYFESLKAWQK